MTYSIKEIFYSLQGEGVNSGKPAVFCRFSGCNLWSGREQHRAKAICPFCDTDFVGSNGAGGGKFRSASALAEAVAAYWPAQVVGEKLLICTGGEPLLQLDETLIFAFHRQGFKIALETNGTLPVPHGIDWICVSPKANAPLVQTWGDELKLIYPQTGLPPQQLEHLGFTHFLLQAMDGANRQANIHAALDYCLQHPRWRLSLQTHKLLGIR